MSVQDPHRFSNLLDSSTTERLINRLEKRAKNEVFGSILGHFDPKYFKNGPKKSKNGSILP